MTVSAAQYPPPLVPKEVENAMQALTIQLLGLPVPTAPTGGSLDKVRVGWQQQGQPAQAINDDVVYLRATEVDDPINRQIDVKNLQNDAVSVGQVTTYIRVWQVYWCAYGPNSFDAMRKIRSGLMSQRQHDLAAVLNLGLYLVPDRVAPRRVPEPKDGGQWWERVDWEVRFNERVSELEIVDAIASSEIIVENADGVQTDVTIGGMFTDNFLPPRMALGNSYLYGSGPFVFDASGVSCPLGLCQSNPAILDSRPQFISSVEVTVPLFDVSQTNNNSIGLLLRLSGAPVALGSYYLAFISANHPSVQLEKVVPGGGALLGQIDDFAFTPNVDFKFEAVGSKLTVSINGVPVIEAEDSELPSGLTGFITTGGAIATFTSTKL